MAIGTTLKIGFNGTAVKRGLDGMKSGMKSAAKSAAIAGAAVGAIAVGLVFAAKKAIDLGLAINKMGEEAGTAENRLRHAVKSVKDFAESSDEVGTRVIELNKVLARQYGIDTKILHQASAKIAVNKNLAKTMGEVGGSFDRAMITAIDLAARVGDVESNAMKLAVALNEPLRGMNRLRSMGITFTANQKDLIKSFVESGDVAKAQGIILAEVEKKTRGYGAATADASARISVGFQQIKESFAMGFSEAFTDLPDQMDGAITAMIERVAPIGKRIGEIINNALTGNVDDLVNVISIMGQTIGNALKIGVWAGMRGVGAGMMDRLTKDPFFAPGSPIKKDTTKHGDAAKELFRLEVQDLMNTFRIDAAEIMKSNPSRSPAPVTDNHPMIQDIKRLLEATERNTRTEQPAAF